MDALKKAAVDSLIKQVLPKLQEELLVLSTSQASLSEQSQLLFKECCDLLAIIDPELTNAQVNQPAAKVIDDDAAMKMLEEMDKPAIDDDAAMKMLEEMDKPADSAESPAEKKASEPEEELFEIDEWEANDFQTDPDMIQDFNSNSDEIMNNLDESILRLERAPKDREIIEEIFRGAHTLKGAAGMFGFRGLERVMHRMENLFDLIRKDKLVVTADTIDVVFRGLDLLRELLQAVKDGKPCGVATVPVVKALEEVANGKTVSLKKVEKKSDKEETSTEPEEKTEANSQKKKEQSTIRVDLERLDMLVNLVGELVIDRTRFASIEEELRTNYPQIELASSISETVQLFERHMNKIQDIIMKVRMVPIGNAFNKFTRIVRDLARSLGKQIELHISGESAELDKTMVEQLGDPLIHLIRNSCDHGIEMPEDRLNAGKDTKGNIYLSASQEGNNIVITIQDDGKGMNPQVIRRKAVEKGIIGEEESLSNRDIFNLIFEAGFSTAEKVTNISGRGVGMDVVKKQIMKLNGMLEIDSAFGQGTVITIRLPLTLAIVQSLLVRSRGEVFAIPLSSVIESIRVAPSDIQRVGDTEVYKLRDRVLPLINLEDALNLQTKDGSIAEALQNQSKLNPLSERRAKGHDRIFIVVVGHADRPTGIIVDQLLNQQEMVIKSMGSLMQDIPGVAGGAVLGHGEVVLVLDIPELEDLTKSRNRGLVA